MRKIAIVFFVAHLSCLASDTSGTIPALSKKLIQYGWGIPTPEFIRKNIRAMEKRPFDGLIFQLRGGATC